MNTRNLPAWFAGVFLTCLAGCTLAPRASVPPTLPEAISQSDSQDFLFHAEKVARAFNIELTRINPPPANLAAPGLDPQAYRARSLNPVMRDNIYYYVVRDNRVHVTRAAFSFQLTGESCVREMDVFSAAKGFSLYRGSPYAPGRHWNRKTGQAEMLLIFDVTSGCLSSVQMFDEASSA